MSGILSEIFETLPFPVKETFFEKPPEGPYAVWGESIRTDGGDYTAWPKFCAVTLELMEPSDLDDSKARQQLMDALDAAVEAGEIEPWSAEPRLWLEDLRRYMTTYTFDYVWR